MTDEDKWKYVVKERARKTCEAPKCQTRKLKYGELHAHHIFTKKRETTRWDPENGICVCPGCHGWVHKHPTKFENWLIKTRGEKWFYDLKRRSNIIATPELLENSKQRLEEAYRGFSRQGR